MSNNTSVSGITKPTEYTLLDNNHKYLPRDFTFIPTVSSKSDDNDITKTVENALTNTNYYTCTPQDFVYKIEVKNNSNSVVYKTENKSACVYKISSEGKDVYKYCESSEVDISALGDANINIGNVTVTKDNNVLEPIAKSLSCTEPDATKEITVPKDYGSLKINSSDVYFRQESSSDSPSWVTISNSIVSFSSDIKPSENIINFFDNNFTIALNDTYFCNNMVDVNLENAYNELNEYNSSSTPSEMLLISALGNEISALVKTGLDANAHLSNEESLNNTASALKAATDLNSAASALDSAATELNSAASALGSDLGSAATDLSRAATNLEQAANNLKQARDSLTNAFFGILNASLSLKRQKLLDANNEWNKKESVSNDDKSLSDSIINNFKDNFVLNDTFIESFSKLKATYAIYTAAAGNIGFADLLGKKVVVVNNNNNHSVLKETLEYYYTIDNPPKDIKFVALDTDKKMIIYEETEKTYKLVYRDNSNNKSILLDGDYFITTDSTSS